MWPFSSYPEYSPSQIDGKTYDYIIVGGGTAGCVVASRLSEDHNVSVLVIEKGHVKDNFVSRMPLASQDTFLGDVLQVQANRWSEPIPGANRRRNRLWGVEGIGGATRVNGMLWTRGFRGDYAAWSEMGLEDWSYEKVEPYFQKIENAIAHPDSKSRGHKGPIELRQFTFPFVWTTYMEQATQKLGLRLERDINDPVAPAMGSFNMDTAINSRGSRISALTAYLNKTVVSQRHDHLTICTGAVASRLEADSQTGLVTGVHVRCSKGPPREFFVKIQREVIVCSGALCTPQLLLLSGIGRTNSSEKLGIPFVKELPAVGATLSDHYSIPIMLDVPRKETFHILETIWGIWHILLWLFFGKGFLGLSSVSTAIYIRTGAIDKSTMQVKSHDEEGYDNLDASSTRNIPDIESRSRPCVMSLYPTLLQPHGSGSVELASTDPLAQPRVVYPMYTNENDIASARLAVRFTMRLADELQHSGYPYPARLAFAPGQDPSILEENVTDDDIDDYLKRVTHTSSHFSGTCPMSNDEKSGVVDQELRVHGFSNLRIADASIFPKIPSCHTMAPVMMVAERCADFVKATWRGKKSQ
ncbi:GMC oxidoreductase [Hypoxylon sp. EC38]|nr:GMC oxidoreductase [Hypoxylon sp. EC38]